MLIATDDPFLTALALVELDGLARRVILLPPDLSLEHLPYVMQYAEVDTVISDGHRLSGASVGDARHALCTPTLVARGHAGEERLATEWILLTSGTTGRPKIVPHTLASLTGAIAASEPQTEVIWGTFYDIRRYGGLQIFLRAVLTGSSLVLTRPQEPLASFLQRAGEAGVTHISGTPSHWRRALMSPEARCIAPRYVRLSGEIADQAILNSLRDFFPNADISHAFATTEAGVAFDVRDGQSGFPVSVLTDTPGVDLKVVDSTLRVRSSRTAERYLGENVPVLRDAEGFVDTGDVLELREGRYYFQGRRDGVINVGGLKVHPEEVEAVLNGHPQVRLSLVKTKKSPITGALVVADVLLQAPATPVGAEARELAQVLTRYCRDSLAPYKVPAAINFVPKLDVSETGKLVRRHA
ncbi:MAG TPA: long-chain fatty acid--CoA ligase [Planctomycetaceae bacterium]|nr:long-chain fatty acid--CoA ligase [Planctomycetaceae bacterium]